MNKGRNIMIILCCLLLLGLLTFLSRTKSNNYSDVVDGVRYIMKGAENNVKNYEFYFKDDKVMTGSLIHTAEYSEFKIYIRGEFDKEIQDFYTEPYEYTYKIYGTEKDNTYIEWEYTEGIDEKLKVNKPYAVFSEDVFKTMVFGQEPFISISQALVVAIFAVGAGLIIGKAEELWHIIYRKNEDDYPAWDDMNGIKRVGIGIFIFDAILLVIFIAI